VNCRAKRDTYSNRNFNVKLAPEFFTKLIICITADLPTSLYVPPLQEDDDHVDGVRLRLRTEAINGPIFYPPGDVWSWRTTVEVYRQGKLLNRPPELQQSYKQSCISKVGGTGEENDTFSIRFFYISKVSLTCHKSYDIGPTILLPLRRKARCGLLSPSAGFEPASNGKHDNH
jgi:hypothetical protein